MRQSRPVVSTLPTRTGGSVPRPTCQLKRVLRTARAAPGRTSIKVSEGHVAHFRRLRFEGSARLQGVVAEASTLRLASVPATDRFGENISGILCISPLNWPYVAQVAGCQGRHTEYRTGHCTDMPRRMSSVGSRSGDLRLSARRALCRLCRLSPALSPQVCEGSGTEKGTMR